MNMPDHHSVPQPEGRDASAYMERALDDIAESLLIDGCWPAPQPRRLTRVLIDLDSFINERFSAREQGEMLTTLLVLRGEELCDRSHEMRSEIVERGLRDWLRGLPAVADHAADLAREAEEERERDEEAA